VSHSPNGQGGAALLIALILMAVLTVVAAATLRFSLFGLRVAVNEELRSEAFQNAQSLIDAVLAVPQNLMITALIDETNCVAGTTGCTYSTLVLKDGSGTRVTSTNLADSGSSILLRRVGPEVSTPPRNTGYSAVKFQASYLRVESAYDGTAGGWGQAGLNEGVTVVVPMYGG
jgi:Tfp pilus assembly protein PilX